MWRRNRIAVWGKLGEIVKGRVAQVTESKINALMSEVVASGNVKVEGRMLVGAEDHQKDVKRNLRRASEWANS